MLCFRKFPVAKKFMDRRGWGVECQDFPSNSFVSNLRKTSQENPSVLCFRKFPVARKFIDMRGGSIKVFHRNFFVYSAENFHWGILYCCIDFVYRKSLNKSGRGVVSRFSVKIFCLTVPKFSVRESFTVALTSDIEKVG